MKTKHLMTMAAGLISLAVAAPTQAQPPSPEETTALAQEAYIYGLPLIMSYKTMYAYAVEKKGADGSVTLYLRKESPGKELESNWLPAPDGPFYTLLRLYWPEQAFLDKTWKLPPMRKAR